MSSVSVVVPALLDRGLLSRHLPPLLDELRRRAAGDEVILVDDTGRGELAEWVEETFPAADHPELKLFSTSRNEGFAHALRLGVEHAGSELVFAMNPDILPRPGFLEPLIDCLAESDVSAATPRVLLFGDEARVESHVEIELERGEVRLRQRGLEGAASELPTTRTPVAFAVGGACLLRRDEFLAAGGFDPLYAPFYLEDLDHGWSAWRAGRRVLYEPASVVEHHHRGTIGRVASPELVRAAIEKNQLLFQWKFLDGEENLRDHLGGLWRRAVNAYLADEREPLVWLALALEQLDDALEARHELPEGPDFDEVLRRAGGSQRGSSCRQERGH